MKSNLSRGVVILVMICSSLTLFSCKKDATAGPGEVFIKDDLFSPSSITVSKGSSVTWTNKGSNTHTVTSDDALFDSGDKTPGQTYTLVFDSIGTFPYHCMHHSVMHGSVKVE